MSALLAIMPNPIEVLKMRFGGVIREILPRRSSQSDYKKVVLITLSNSYRGANYFNNALMLVISFFLRS